MASPGGGRLGRSWRRFRRRPQGVQVASAVVALVLVVAVVFAVGAGSPGTPSGTTTTSAPIPNATPGQASTSNAGVTSTSIRVVFPVSNLSSLASSFGFAGDVEYSEQSKAIKLFVKLINDGGGIHGRKIDARDRQLRSHQRGRDAGPVQAVDRGQRSGLRRARRGRDLDRRQPAVHHPGRPYATAQPVDDGDQLDRGGLALPVVDRPRRCGHPAGHRGLGAQRRAPRDPAARWR